MVSLRTVAATLALVAAALAVNAAPTNSPSQALTAPDVASYSPEGFPINSLGEELHLIQTESNAAPVWLTEDKVWELKQEDVDFMDVTLQPDLASKAAETRRANRKPSNLMGPENKSELIDEAAEIIALTNTELIESTLNKLTSFHNRYYRSATGTESANWLFQKVKSVGEEQAQEGVSVTVRQFEHSFNQPSVIARIECAAVEGDDSCTGETETVVIGSHQDSINSWDRTGRAPGADDDGSGTVASLEAFRAILASGFKPKRPIEFHWYAGEEAGLLGSQDIAASYQREGRKVAGMMQLDMTGTPKAGRPNEIGFVSDNVNLDLTSQVELLAQEILPDVTSRRFRCGYGCSDHASWTKAGYRSVFPFESAGLSDNRNIHTVNDTVDKVNFNHVLRFSKIAIAYAVHLSKQ